jgi:AcrR family transcriptional regulator
MAKIGRPLAMSIEERRKEIFLIAEKLFGDQGYEHVTMSDIATLAGMSKKTLYVYFKDKKQLLKELVASSYIWAEDSFEEEHADAIQQVKSRLKVSAKHVLSERHIKLCRLVIAESGNMTELSKSFYDMGVEASRNHLIAAIVKIDKTNLGLNLQAEVLADMLFGAAIAQPFIDTLIINQPINFAKIMTTIDNTVDALFIQSDTMTDVVV